MTGMLWGAAWLITVPSPAAGTAVGALMLTLFAVVFALGESVWSPTVPALVNSIAPDHLRGRYNSAQSLTWSLSAMLAPLPAGLLIGGGNGELGEAVGATRLLGVLEVGLRLEVDDVPQADRCRAVQSVPEPFDADAAGADDADARDDDTAIGGHFFDITRSKA